MTPDFSPAMLKRFLRARADIAGFKAIFPSELSSARKVRKTFNAALKEERAAISRRSGVSDEQFDLAWQGRLSTADPRRRIWIALNADPEFHGVRLLDKGKQEEGR